LDRDRYSAVHLKVVAHRQHIIYKELACKSTKREQATYIGYVAKQNKNTNFNVAVTKHHSW